MGEVCTMGDVLVNNITDDAGPVAEAGPTDRIMPPGDWAHFETVVDMFDQSAKTYGDRPCLDFLGKQMTYGEVSAMVDKAAAGFQHLGVVKGTRVGLCLPNTPYYVICYFALLKIGGVVVNINPLYVERELEHLIGDSGAEIVVTLDLKQIYPKVASCLDTTGLKRVIVCAMEDILSPVKSLLFSVLKRSELSEFPKDPRHMSFKRLTNTDGRFKPINITPEADLAVLQYTGGTTGVPKGAMLSHRNLAANTNQIGNWMPEPRFGYERVLGVLPFFHVFAMTVVMNVGLSIGAELVLLPRFNLDQVLKAIHKRKPTCFPGVPTIYSAIMGAPDLKKYDLSSLKYCISGGAPLPVEVKHEFEEKTGCTLVEGYGLSEASPVLTCNPVLLKNKAGSIGVALGDTEMEIRDPEDPTRRLAQGEKGEVCGKGPQVMMGYWDRPQETEKVLIDGWLRTGDIGYMDDEGYIFLVDRLKDVILCSGFNVYPRMIEEALYLHPAVSEVTVIGVPDDYRGQAPKAFVKLSEDHDAVTAADLKEFLKDKISRIEMPRDIEFRDELPKTLIGKLSKKELVQEEAEKKQA